MKWRSALDWTIEITEDAEKLLSKMGKVEAKRIATFLRERLQKAEHPRALGKPLKGGLRDYWRYRTGDYRIICRIEDDIITVFVVHIGNRSKVYK